MHPVRVDPPDWATEYQTSVDAGVPEDVVSIFEAQILVIENCVDNLVGDFLRHTVLHRNGVVEFPSAERLSGEYYISSSSLWYSSESWFEKVGRSSEYCASVIVHLLELANSSTMNRDYVGLEYVFTLDRTSQKFVLKVSGEISAI